MVTSLTWYDLLGLVGVAQVLSSYYLLQIRLLAGDSWRYLFLNLSGTIMVLTSLLFDWNLAGFLINSAWVLITAYGIARKLKVFPR